MISPGYEPLFYSFNLNNPLLWYAEDPPYKNGKARKISTQELEAFVYAKSRSFFHYSDNIWRPTLTNLGLFQSFMPQVIKNTDMLIKISAGEDGLPEKMLAVQPDEISKLACQLYCKNFLPRVDISQIDEWFSDPNKGYLNILDSLVVSWINEKIGFGVFARKPIAKGTIVVIYSGQILFGAQASEMLTTNNYAVSLFSNKDFSLKIDAEFHGGISRFLSHLPTPWSLEAVATYQKTRTANYRPVKSSVPLSIQTLEFTDSSTWQNLDRIATANLSYDFALYNGWPIVVMRALVDINPGELLGFDYGEFFWNEKGLHPAIFAKNGEPLSNLDYYYLFHFVPERAYCSAFDVMNLYRQFLLTL